MPKNKFTDAISSDATAKRSRSELKKDEVMAPHVSFLLKSEPHEFAVQDLLTKPKHESIWDGIRNFEAAKIMRTMKVGDRAYFYHSSCKEIGIVGIVEVFLFLVIFLHSNQTIFIIQNS
jgi:hypothetical protein